MRTRALAAFGFIAAVVLPSVAAAAEEDGYRHGRVRFVESGVTLHRATEVSAEEALANLPFLPGDRVWTDASGRVEFQFPDGTLVRLDNRSKLDYAGHEEGREEHVVLRLWSGSLIARVRTKQAARFEVETPAGSVELLDQAMVRVDVEAGEMRVSAYRGEAVVDDGRGRVRLSAGERTAARWGQEAAAPEPFDIAPEDDFASWDEARESEERLASRSSEYLPDELDPYAGELERNGSWRFEAAVGYVWAPRVSGGWSPYANGYWSWTPYGWTWVPYETWGWAPFHYGRWGFSASFGWYWAPGRTWGPGWVSWGVGSGYVGWCPLGYRDRPVHPWGGYNRGYAVPRHGGYGGWNVVRDGDFGQRDVARRRLPLTGIDPRALQVADSANLRPTRNGRSLVASSPTARAISRRPTPGDFVRELAVDNKTTIPSPWLRRGQARADGARARESRDAADQASAARPRPGALDSGAAQRGFASRPASRPRTTTSAPAYAPRTEGSASSAAPAREPRQRETAGLPQGRHVGLERRAERGRARAGQQRPAATGGAVGDAAGRRQRLPAAGAAGGPAGAQQLARRVVACPCRVELSPLAQRLERRPSGGQRSSGGERAGGGQRSASRPPRDRH